MREERGRGRERGQGTVEGKGEQGKMAEQNPKCICGDITAFPTEAIDTGRSIHSRPGGSPHSLPESLFVGEQWSVSESLHK